MSGNQEGGSQETLRGEPTHNVLGHLVSGRNPPWTPYTTEVGVVRDDRQSDPDPYR